MHIALANMTGNIDRKPELHVFFDAHVDWFAFSNDLPRLDTDHELLAKYKKVEV